MNIASLSSLKHRTVLAALASAAVFLPSVQAAPTVGEPAPAFTAVDATGKNIALDQYRGKTVVLEWTNHECPYVKKHYESNNIQTLQKEAAAQGVVWLSVISSAPGNQGYVQGADALRLTKERGAAPANVLLDPKGDLGRLYNARTTPHLFIIDASGKLVYQGGIDDKPTSAKADLKDAKNFVRAALSDIAGKRAVSTPVSQPYGCSVKYAS